MERIIARSLLDHLRDNALLSTEQHGFIPGRSTCTNLLEEFNDWTLIVQNKHGIAVANIDFSKAIGCVSHNKLFARFAQYGVCGTLLLWSQRFFSGRTVELTRLVSVHHCHRWHTY